jgi:hypothetical protein
MDCSISAEPEKVGAKLAPFAADESTDESPATKMAVSQGNLAREMLVELMEVILRRVAGVAGGPPGLSGRDR